MIQLITPSVYSGYRQEMQDMHRQRYRVFKERLGWNVQAPDDYERDQFDALDPLYVVAIDEDDELVGSWRFLPTTGPYMLRDVFPELLGDQPAPNDPGIWEGSRFAVERSHARGQTLGSVSQVAGEILCAVVLTCMAHGVRELLTVYDARMARLLPRLGCPPTWQSHAIKVGEGTAMAGRFDMTLATLERIQIATRRRAPAKRRESLQIFVHEKDRKHVEEKDEVSGESQHDHHRSEPYRFTGRGFARADSPPLLP